MAYLIFIDESGQDHRYSPYEVLAGVAIHDSALWELIQSIKIVEQRYFGDYYKQRHTELKARNLLKSKTFRLASQLPKIDDADLPDLAQACLRQGSNTSRLELTALAQARLTYTQQVLRLCQSMNCRTFASIVDYDSAKQQLEFEDFSHMGFLRKDYSFLFERFFYFLEDISPSEMGIIVFDELDRSKSHILYEQLSQYFVQTHKGKQRASQIIPEPFFVHSELTTGIHLADLVAYVILWGFRINNLTKPRREELQPWVEIACNMRYQATRIIPDIGTEPANIWSFAIIT